MTSSTTPIAGSPTTRRCSPSDGTRMRDPCREGCERIAEQRDVESGYGAAVGAPMAGALTRRSSWGSRFDWPDQVQNSHMTPQAPARSAEYLISCVPGESDET